MGFDGRGLKLFDTTYVVGALATAIILASLAPVWAVLTSLGDLLGGLTVVILLAAGIALTSLGYRGESGGMDAAAALTRYGLAHMVALPLVTVMVCLASQLNGGAGTGDLAFFGLPARVTVVLGSATTATAPAVSLIFVFIAVAVGLAIKGLVSAARRK
jgi:hypothetical protein